MDLKKLQLRLYKNDDQFDITEYYIDHILSVKMCVGIYNSFLIKHNVTFEYNTKTKMLNVLRRVEDGFLIVEYSSIATQRDIIINQILK